MKVAICYDRVNKWGGAERVLLALHGMFPEAPLYTSVYDAGRAPWATVFPRIHTSFLQGLKWARVHHELLAPLMPLAFESFDFSEYDLVISVTSEAAKGIITGPHTKHVCYCLTPTRYLWSGYEDYFQDGILIRWVTWPMIRHLRRWDKIAAQRPDEMVGISREVVRRIKKYYGREAKIIYPPGCISPTGARGPAAGFPPRTPTRGPLLGGPPSRVTPRTGYFLVVSRLVPYKRVDLAIDAFNKLGFTLVIVGTGSEEMRLKRIAKSNIHFLGQLTDGELARYYGGASALIFPQKEDFGLTAVEAQSMGTPVIAYSGGGALETVVEGVTGEFFYPQTVEALVDAVRTFDKKKYNSKDLINNAKRFSRGKFKKGFTEIASLHLQ